MRWTAILALILALAGSARAAGSDEQYLDIYNEILQADSLQQNGHPDAAALRYLQAQSDLQKLQTDHPTWNPDIVKYRLDYLTGKLSELGKYLPSTNGAPAAVSNPAAASAPGPASEAPTIAALQQQNANFQEQIRSLTAANVELQGKLKEALTVQPAAVSPTELAKAQAEIVALKKERDLLQVALDQDKAANESAVAAAKTAAAEQAVADLKARTEEEAKKTQMELALAKEAAAAAETKLAVANKQLDEMKAARAMEADQAASARAQAAAESKRTQDEMDRLKEAGAESDKILAAATKELELLRGAHPVEIQTPEGKQIPEEGDQLKQLMAQVSTDEAQITQLKAAVADGEKKLGEANSELDALRSKQPPAAVASDSARAIAEERDKLKDELAQRSKDLADAEARHIQELLNVRATLEQAQAERDELAKKLAGTPSVPSGAPPPVSAAPTTDTSTNSAVAQKLEQLEARIAVLEASPVPYTPDEMTLLKMPAQPEATDAAKPPPVQALHVHSVKDLPPGAGPLWEEAKRASLAGDFTTAEQKYNEVLHQDENNVYVLAFLANVQFAAGQLAECEKTVQRALAIDPD